MSASPAAQSVRRAAPPGHDRWMRSDARHRLAVLGQVAAALRDEAPGFVTAALDVARRLPGGHDEAQLWLGSIYPIARLLRDLGAVLDHTTPFREAGVGRQPLMPARDDDRRVFAGYTAEARWRDLNADPLPLGGLEGTLDALRRSFAEALPTPLPPRLVADGISGYLVRGLAPALDAGALALAPTVTAATPAPPHLVVLGPGRWRGADVRATAERLTDELARPRGGGPLIIAHGHDDRDAEAVLDALQGRLALTANRAAGRTARARLDYLAAHHGALATYGNPLAGELPWTWLRAEAHAVPGLAPLLPPGAVLVTSLARPRRGPMLAATRALAADLPVWSGVTMHFCGAASGDAIDVDADPGGRWGLWAATAGEVRCMGLSARPVLGPRPALRVIAGPPLGPLAGFRALRRRPAMARALVERTLGPR